MDLSIDQAVAAFMAAVGTYLAAYIVNLARVKWNIIPGSFFVAILVPLIGAGCSYLTTILGHPGNSWLISFMATLGSTWLSQVVAQLNSKTDATQYVIGPAPTPVAK